MAVVENILSIQNSGSLTCSQLTLDYVLFTLVELGDIFRFSCIGQYCYLFWFTQTDIHNALFSGWRRL